ncbi:MAG: alanine--tRNA ligase, partial [Chloroflexi bacterium]|nr:alanine--tRNA ligase [Chloroflexota bacterium]
MARPVTGDEIREAFLRHFEERGHLRLPSSSLIPAADPTLLLTNSGMAQFKAYFSGEAAPPQPRVVTSQKCFRATDIDEVGDDTHLTLFEMLGNFSFAEYFKKEACLWALEFWRDVLEFPVERLYATVHDDDDEAERIWLDLGIPIERIFRFGDSENWWGPAGEEGPCGPASELHYYYADLDLVPGPDDEEYGTTWGPNLSNDFVELYNLVFTQFYHHLDGSRTPLPGQNIDTGMGLERTAVAAQGVTSVYETDIMRPFIARVEELSGKEYGGGGEIDRAIRVVAEHGRSASFLIADGVVPENTGRGYILRRVIRRAMRFGLSLDMKSPFLPEIAEVANERMAHVYPELRENLPFIKTVLATEEERFAEAVESGSRLLARLIDVRPAILQMVSALRAGASPCDAADLHEAESSAMALLSKHLSGDAGEVAGLLERVFEAAADVGGATPASTGKVWDDFLGADWENTITGYEAAYLYDTYGFPIEVTREMALENGFSVDLDGFEREMDLQRQRGRAAGRFGGDAAGQRIYQELDFDETPFLGYEAETATKADSVVAAIIRDGVLLDEAVEGDEIEIVLRETPFFAERGGQMGDAGLIKGEDGVIEISDTQNPYARINVHYGRVSEGKIKVGDGVSAEVDAIRREKIRRNHTGTHLIHAALRQVLGSHVRQSGSLVAPDRLRFDFTHIAAMTRAEILEVQRVVNDRIRANHEVEVEYTTYQDAVANGALAFFGDKYDETNVRTIKIDAPWSYELCGGTHCSRSGDIGSFFILTEQSIGSGMRRIEAFTGVGAEDLVSERLYSLDQISADLQTPVGELQERVNSLRSEADASRRRIAELEASVLRASVSGGGEAVDGPESVDVDGSPVALQVRRVDAPNIDALRKTGDFLRDRLDSGVVVIGSEIDERPMVIAMVTKDLVAKGFHAGEIVKQVARVMGGGGGGRADIAQAGGRDAGKLDEALASVK